LLSVAAFQYPGLALTVQANPAMVHSDLGTEQRMPRVNPLRPVGNEANLARRIAAEREAHGWSYEGLAKRMTDAGFPIQSTAIFKIEKGKPPRRITVDEMVGFAKV